jgi:rhamnulokinase
MGKEKMYIAADFGASNGRVSAGRFDGARIRIDELHRFENIPVFFRGTLYWDFLCLLAELKCGIRKCIHTGECEPASIAVDTWGVDFGLIDVQGDLRSNPVSYRDKRTEGVIEKISKIIPLNELFGETGEVTLEINTIFQLYSLLERHPEYITARDTLLMMPDLFNYALTGEKTIEYSNSVTTQLYDQLHGCWSKRLLELLHIPPHVFPKTVYPGEQVGVSKRHIDEEIGTKKLKVVAPCSHDAASAVIGLPVNRTKKNQKWAFLLIGTWSTLGIELKMTPLISDSVFSHGFSNEASARDRYSLQKIIQALWLIQEFRSYWMKAEARHIDWEEISGYCKDAPPFQNFIDVDDSIFQLKSNDIKSNLQMYYKKTGQKEKLDTAAITRAFYEGLVLKYVKTVRDLEKITGSHFDLLLVTGGGSKMHLLCQWIADATGLPLYKGTPETTTLGNVLMQMLADGEISTVDEGRQIIADSFPVECIEPKKKNGWDGVYEKYIRIVSRNR